MSVRIARAPSDPSHPYGYGKVETLGALSVSVLLLGTASGIGFQALQQLQEIVPLLSDVLSPIMGSHSHHHHHALDMANLPVALSVAVLAIGVKEALYWATTSVGRRVGSQLLEANAWHHRSDAVSTLIAVIGVGGALLGFPLLDPLAAMVVSALILRAGGGIAWSSIQELIDAGLPESTNQVLRHAAEEVPGVQRCSFLRGRKVGSSIHVDVFIEVDPFLSVSGAKRIAEAVRRHLISRFPLLTEALVTIDPADSDPVPPPLHLSEQKGTSHSWGGKEQPIAVAEQVVEVEDSVRRIVHTRFDELLRVEAVTCHFIHDKAVVEVKCSMKEEISNLKELSDQVEASVEQGLPVVSRVNLLLAVTKSIRAQSLLQSPP